MDYYQELYERVVRDYQKKGHNDYNWAHYDGVFYSSDGHTEGGAWFAIFHEDKHSRDDVARARIRLRKDRDVAGIRLVRVFPLTDGE